jgi:hypothetical protein
VNARDATWLNRTRRRYGWLTVLAYAGSRRPLPMHRQACLHVMIHCMKLDRVLWRLGFDGS